MAKDHRLNIRIDSKLMQKVKLLAKKQHTTVSAIIAAHLHHLVATHESVKKVRKLAHDAEQV